MMASVPDAQANTHHPTPVVRVVVMGVSGAGKSTVAKLLADTLGAGFVDGDDLHPPANVARMSAGIALTDDDRWPWLDTVGRRLAAAGAPGLVVACSALRRTYRDAIRARASDARFVLLQADRAELHSRLERRIGHFMGPDLLDSQLRTLEPLESDEAGVTLDVTAATDVLASRALQLLDLAR